MISAISLLALATAGTASVSEQSLVGRNDQQLDLVEILISYSRVQGSPGSFIAIRTSLYSFDVLLTVALIDAVSCLTSWLLLLMTCMIVSFNTWTSQKTEVALFINCCWPIKADKILSDMKCTQIVVTVQAESSHRLQLSAFAGRSVRVYCTWYNVPHLIQGLIFFSCWVS